MTGEVASALYNEELYQVKKKATVVITVPWEQVSESDRVLLQNILKAVGLTTDGVNIVAQPVLSIEPIRLIASKVIYFGPAIEGIPQFEPTSVEGIVVIFSPPLDQLQADAGSKQKLWSGLKLLFVR